MGREGSGGRFPFLVTNSPPAVWCSGPTGLPAHRVLCGHAWGLPSRTPSWPLSPQHTPLKQGLTARAMAMGLASFSQGVVEVQRGERAGERALSCLQVASSQGLLPARRRIQGDECGPFLFPPFFFFRCGIQGHCQKHIQHNQTSDGDSFPTACVSENSEIIPMF